MLGLPNHTVRLVDHHEDWSKAFDQARQRLADALGDLAVNIQHIGSTAIPGIKAKPILDGVVGVKSPPLLEEYSEQMQAAGFPCGREVTELGKDWIVFSEGDPARHHVQVVVHGGDRWNAWIKFRDVLREAPSLALEYQELKIRLAARYPTDTVAYAKEKGEFIMSVLNSGTDEAK